MQVQDFDDYEELARPLPQSESRVFDCGRNKVTYDSYAIALAQDKVTRAKVILVQHGAGKEVIPLPSHWISCAPLQALASTDERACYALLFAIYKSYGDGMRNGKETSAALYQNAFVEGRLKKRKLPSRGVTKVWIENKAA